MWLLALFGLIILTQGLVRLRPRAETLYAARDDNLDRLSGHPAPIYGVQGFPTKARFCSAQKGIRDFLYASQTFFQLSYDPNSFIYFPRGLT